MVRYDTPPATPHPSLLSDRPQIPYLVPFLAYLAIMAPGQFLGHWMRIDWGELWMRYLPAVYTVKTVLAAVLLAVFWKYYTPIRWRHLLLGAGVGVVGVGLWVGIEYLSQRFHITAPPDPKTVYNPLERIHDPAWRWAFYFIRVAGPTLVVPVMEELFFRDFLFRALVRGARFTDVEVGAFDPRKALSWFALLAMSGAFAVNHIQWPSGFVYGLLMGVVLVRTKSLGACIVAHGVTNVVLYALCIYQTDFLGHSWWRQFM